MRRKQNAKLDTANARVETTRQRTAPYYQEVSHRVWLGYRRLKHSSPWLYRTVNPAGGYRVKSLGYQADDFQPADRSDGQDMDGTERVLTYHQAAEKAREKGAAYYDGGADGGTLPETIGVYTVRDATRDYMADYKARSDKATRESQRVIDKDILPKLGNVPVMKLTTTRLTSWRGKLILTLPRLRGGTAVDVDLGDIEVKRRRMATAARKWTLLFSILNFAFRHEKSVTSDVAWRKVDPIKATAIDAPPGSYPSIAECKRIVRKADDDIKPLIEATFLTGCAMGELRRMTVDDYNQEHGTVLVYNSKRRTRNVPLTDEGVALFDELTAGRPGDAPIFTNDGGDLLTKSYHTRRVIEACRAAKVVPAVTLTQIRKTYGSILLNKGVSLDIVSKVMGHHSTDTTKKHYASLLDKTVNDEVRNALPKLGINRNVSRIS